MTSRINGMPTCLAPLCLGWKLPGLYTLGVEFLEHAALMRRPVAAKKTEHLKEDIHIPFIKPFCINSLQLPELRPTLNS